MIAVVADDLAGAAEVAGAGVRHALSAEVRTALDASTDADLVVIDADTRSLPPERAAARTAEVARQVRGLRPEWIYRKTDSVLRGHVLAELRAMLSALSLPRALLVPANPSLGRIVRDGRYFVNGLPVHQSHFAREGEHPAGSSDVLEMLGAPPGGDVRVLAPGQAIPGEGIVVGQAAGANDLARWAEALDDSTLPAGAAEFFSAILAARGHPPGPALRPLEARPRAGGALFACGSIAGWRRWREGGSPRPGIAVVPMPGELLTGDDARSTDAWAYSAERALRERGAAVVAIARPALEAPRAVEALAGRLAEVVGRLVERGAVTRLFVEGGATASAVLRRLGWTRLSVRREVAPGVVALEPLPAGRVIVTIKPGSYPWPEEVF